MERMAAKKAAGTYYEKPRLEEESRECQALRVLTGEVLQRMDGESSHLKALSSLKTLQAKLDYIDTYFEPGSWLCTRCKMPRPASESKCQAWVKAGYVDADGRALWAQCTGSQVSSWGGIFRV